MFEGVWLTAMDHFLEGLDPSLCGKHLLKLLRRIKDDASFTSHCNNVTHFLGMLKEGFYHNGESFFMLGAWKALGIFSVVVPSCFVYVPKP